MKLPTDRVTLIGEIGINHQGDIKIAKKLIDATYACSWDVAKFQKRTPILCVPEEQRDILKETPWGVMTYLEYKERMEFGKDEYDSIDVYCREKGIPWTASVWDVESLDFITKYDVPFIKIPSAKLTDSKLIKATLDTGKTIVLSTGMSTLEEIDKAVLLITSRNEDFVLMHCNSTYPTPPMDINLNVIKTLQKRYRCQIGYSGHEYSLEPTVGAVALGANLIERHVTLDHSMWGTDQKSSLEISAMHMLRKRIDELFIAKGDGVKRITEEELKVRKRLRG
jgi:N-acetylneuraminate synthase